VKEALIHAGTLLACIKQTLTVTAAESEPLILSFIAIGSFLQLF
jgi:hypothetical protein